MSWRSSASPRGRYVRGDVCPSCSGDEPRSSRLESDVFNVLQFVLGPGERDIPMPGDRRMWLDMRFRGRDDLLIGVEYDGAYWHRDREQADLRKSERLTSTRTAAVVVRIRESPLTPLTPEDICVRAGESSTQIAIATLLHLIHLELVDLDVVCRAAAALAAAAVKTDRCRIFCRPCREVLVDLERRGFYRGRRVPIRAVVETGSTR